MRRGRREHGDVRPRRAIRVDDPAGKDPPAVEPDRADVTIATGKDRKVRGKEDLTCEAGGLDVKTVAKPVDRFDRPKAEAPFRIGAGLGQRLAGGRLRIVHLRPDSSTG